MSETTIQAPAGARDGWAAGRRRWRLLGLLGAVVAVGALAWGAYWFVISSRYVATDNAYVGADTAQVTPLIAGQVARVLAAETQTVRAGQLLVVLDDADARNGVEQAQAALGQAERQVRGYFANDTALAAQVAAKRADVARADAQIAGAQGDLVRARIDLARRQALAASGAVSGDELTSAQNRLSTTRSALVAARA
ncbi:MAG: HlyD family secretion protein, partial [Caulobacteraceae bacterium]